MTIKEEFEKRIIEIESFYEILEIIEMEKPNISAYNINKDKDIILAINNQKIDILRSTAYLLMYNLIESTIYNSIVSIFNEIEDKNLRYFDIIEELRSYWLNSRYKHDNKSKKETIINTILQITNEIFNNTIVLVSNQINYGGSLDTKNIINTANSMKIETGTLYKKINEDKDQYENIFRDIKNNRNWLAHGEKSFIEVGSKSTYLQLQNAKTYVLLFLKEYISSVEKYINNEEYRAKK
jgi:hypothetical protein|nr:MAE_28990/MAE_18760 family HEPN-like nuclease [uncultured Capnocytophaga sp.]